VESTFSMNTLRVVLVGISVLAAAVSFGIGQWTAGVYLSAAVAVHGVLWVFLNKQRAAEQIVPHTTVQTEAEPLPGDAG
jgi:hypothetical protein